MNILTPNTKYEYMNKKAINEYLICPICMDPLIDPVSTNCQPKAHTFCRNCIEKWIKIKSLCPSCNQELGSQHLTPVAAINFIDMLNDLSVECLGCKQTGLKRIDFDAHYNGICPKTNIECPSSDIGCSWTGTQEELNEHLKICNIDRIKPLIIGFQGREQLEDRINQLQNQNETLLNENQQLKKGGNKLRTPNVGPLKADHSLYDKGNDQQTRISAYLKGSKQVIREIDLQKILNELNQNQIQTATILKDYKKIQIDFKALQEENQQLTSQQQQKLENSTNKLPNPSNYEHNYERQNKSRDDYTVTDNFDHTNYFNYYPGFNPIYNQLHRDYHAPDNGHSNDYNSFGTFPGGDVTQNANNRPNIVPFIIPIPIPISINTNITGGNNNNATGNNTNTAGGSNNNNNNPGRSINNIVDGANNNIAGGNNNAGNNNNNIAGGSHNNIITSNNNVGRHRTAGFNNVLDNNQGNPRNNLASNSNNITGGNGNNIGGGNNNVGDSSNNIAGGNNNSVRINICDHNVLNNPVNDQYSEDNADDSGISVTDERRTGSSISGDQIGRNPSTVSRPASVNYDNY